MSEPYPLIDRLACPACRHTIEPDCTGFVCSDCGRRYPAQGGIPALVVSDANDLSGLKEQQAAFFDNEEDPEFEITRPHGSPALYRWLLAEKFRRSVSEVEHLLRGSTALTVCCGSGMDAELLAGLGARVIASDLSLGAVKRTGERARRRGFSVDLIVADAEHLPFRDRSVDFVYVHDGFHHLADPAVGLAEMARVARIGVSVSEPALAALTSLAVRLGLALEQEESGNRVERLTLDDVRSTLTARGFRVVAAERYGMYYRHKPGRAVRLLSHQPLLGLAQVSFRLANVLAGPLGNKLTVQAVRESA